MEERVKKFIEFYDVMIGLGAKNTPPREIEAYNLVKDLWKNNQELYEYKRHFEGRLAGGVLLSNEEYTVECAERIALLEALKKISNRADEFDYRCGSNPTVYELGEIAKGALNSA